MGQIMGVEVEDIRFPIAIPRRKLGITKPYFVFSPFAARRGPRSLPLKTVISVMSKSPIPIVFVDSLKYDFEIGPNASDCSGGSMLDLIALLDGCEGVISCDTGVPYIGAALGKPSLVLFAHVDKNDRVQTISNCWGIDSPIDCARSCGDHVGTSPPCRLREAVAKCVSYYTPEYVKYLMREFAWMIA
jgi:ADP-heptose:LPS heptosyltransferase